MYECVNLKKNRIPELKRLNELSAEFNILNSDFFEEYGLEGFARRFMQRRKVRLLRRDNDYSGFIWFEPYTSSTCLIKSIFSSEKENLEAYRILVDSVPGCRVIKYWCESNDFNFRILESLGFEKSPGEIEMRLDREGIERALLNRTEVQAGLVFKIFQKGKDEGLRCWVQNDIFENIRRVPLTLEDIIHDVSQRYFLQGGFLYHDGECIGYGQIVIHEDIPFIVNIGIIKDHRGRGYGRVILEHFLELAWDNGFEEIRLNVKSDNLAAVNLYRSLGFKGGPETCKWELKR